MPSKQKKETIFLPKFSMFLCTSSFSGDTNEDENEYREKKDERRRNRSNRRDGRSSKEALRGIRDYIIGNFGKKNRLFFLLTRHSSLHSETIATSLKLCENRETEPLKLAKNGSRSRARPLIHSLTPRYSIRLLVPLRSLAYSIAPELVGKKTCDIPISKSSKSK